ncbi:MAG: FecR domain-containing protein, partial [Acidobacteriota bacterium]|nr:FecR domain-containing protein [Acidobacteriota bacterium]
MKSLGHLAYLLLLAMFFSSSTLIARADQDDPPSRAVDIRYITGQVSIQPGGVDDWAGAVVNRPLTTADRVWADRDSRAELQLGSAALRLNSETSLTLTNVSDQTVQVELDQGTLNLTVRRLYGGEIYEVDTPNLAFTLTRSGVYRFDVDPNQGTTRVSVFKGEGEATGEGNAVRLRAGEEGYFDNGTSLENQVNRIERPDGFDDWARLRDDREDRSQSYRYVSQDMVGAEDLDEYGTWRSDPEYGSMWVPSHVQRGWAPYHDGHWAWVEPWGWTWVDDQPWGYAPSHYGRWVYRDSYWGWTPGPPDVRPVYAPALVAWVGGAAWGASVSFGGGEGVGWFPLGYGEPYVPSYRASRQYFQNVNTSNTRITNITNVTNNYYTNNSINTNNVNNIRYVNQTVPGAMIAVPRTAMVNAQPVSRVAVQVPTQNVARAAIATAPPVAPDRKSVLGAKADVRAAAPPQQAAAPRAVITKTAPPPRPVPFAARQDALAKNPGRPLDTQAVQQIRARLPEPPARAPAPTRPAGQPRPANNGQPERNAGAPGANQNAPASRNAGAPERPNAPPQQNNENRSGANPNPNNNPNAPDRNVPRPPNSGAPANSGQPANNSRPNNPGNQPAVNTGSDRPAQRPPNNGQPGNERNAPVVERAPANDRPPNDRPSNNPGNNT